MENDSIKISFYFNSLNAFCTFSAHNKTHQPITVDWDKFCMVMEGESKSIIFDDTKMINKNSKKILSLCNALNLKQSNRRNEEYLHFIKKSIDR